MGLKIKEVVPANTLPIIIEYLSPASGLGTVVVIPPV
jgi:hypothetical protein